MFQKVSEGSRGFQKVTESKSQGHIVMQGTFRLCAFLFYVSKSKPQGQIVMQGTFRLCAFLRIEIGMHKDRTLQYDNKESF